MNRESIIKQISAFLQKEGFSAEICLEIFKEDTPLYRMITVPQNPLYHPEGNVGQHTLKTLTSLTRKNPQTLWAALLHDVGKEAVTEIHENGKITSYRHEYVGSKTAALILKELGFQKEFTENVVYIVRNHMKIKQSHVMKRNKVLALMEHPAYSDLKAVAEADVKGSSGEFTWLHRLNSLEPEPVF